MLVILCATAILALWPRTAAAATITVNSLANTAANDGVCTLREAIEAANLNTASGAMSGECAAGSAPVTVDLITFSVTGTIDTSVGGGVLPGIGDAGGDDAGYVTIDGDTNNDQVPDITLDRNGSGGDGLHIGRGTVAAVNVTITGIEIRESGGQGIDVERAEDLIVEDCYIHDGGNQGIRINHNDTDRVTIRRLRVGLDGSGAASGNDGNGIQINDGADNVTIENCVISANGASNSTGDGIQIAGGGASATGHIIRDNLIGTDLLGTTCGASGGNPPWNTFGNSLIGIDITGNPSNVTIEDNVIGCSGRLQTTGGSQGDGIEVTGGSSNNFLIDGNYIGTNSSGTALGNAQNGIQFDAGDNATISNNTIAFNGVISTGNHQDGIGITGPGSDGHTITQNSIHSNDGLGIDLGPNGVLANDAGDTDGGSNALQNYPVINSAANNGMGGYDVNYTWDFRTGEGPWTIEFFCNSDGGTQGRRYQASVTIAAGTPNGSQTSTFTPVAGTCNTVANVITATATNSDAAGGSTSEFSGTFNPTAVQLADFRGRANGATGRNLLLAALALAAAVAAIVWRRARVA